MDSLIAAAARALAAGDALGALDRVAFMVEQRDLRPRHRAIGDDPAVDDVDAPLTRLTMEIERTTGTMLEQYERLRQDTIHHDGNHHPRLREILERFLSS